MQRIMIIGNGGSGKTTLANKLSEVLEEKVFHLDLLAWEPGWVRRTEEEFTNKLNHILKEPGWIIEGWSYQSTLKNRLKKANVIIFLNTPLIVCWYDVLKRKLNSNVSSKTFNTPRSKNVLQYFWAIWKVQRKYVPALKKEVMKLSRKKSVYVFKWKKERHRFYLKLRYGQRLKESSSMPLLSLLQEKLVMYFGCTKSFC